MTAEELEKLRTDAHHWIYAKGDTRHAVIDLALKGLEYVEGDSVPIPRALAKSLADGPDSLAVWELRGLLDRLKCEGGISTMENK